MTRTDSRHYTTLVGIAATTLALLGTVMLIRGRIVGVLSQSSLMSLEPPLAILLAASFYDIAFIVGGGILFMALSLLARDSARYQLWLSRSYTVLSLLLLLIYVAHISVMKFLFKPFTYQWLYYSDFLGSFDARQAVAANMNTEMLLVAAGLIIVFLAGRWMLARGLREFGFAPVIVTAGFATLGVSLVLGSGLTATRANIPYSRTAQPVVAFVASLPFGSESIIHTAQASPDVSDFVPPMPAPPGRVAHGVRNVIFYVMESVGAEYVGLYGSSYGATPELDRRKNEALIVSDAYAHSPTTTMSLVSLLTGTYPWVAQRMVTSDFPDIGLTSISSLLKARGYRTGMFYASDLRFQKTDAFLAHRHFDRIHGYRTMPCDSAPYANGSKGSFSTLRWDHLDGIKDECAVQALSDWVDEVAAEPFFGVLWTNQAHYPYVMDTQEVRFGVQDRDLNRYLNAVRAADRGLGKLLERLEARGLADSTLVVVLGDHGEAFGRHGDRGHGSAVYESNIKIPLVFINKRLFRGGTLDAVGGIADIAPTVTDIIGIARGDHWQGRSLTDPARIKRTYFFTPWGDLTFGIRDGDMKYIFNATYNTFQVFDLRQDPLEAKDLSALHADKLPSVKARLAAWVQFQDRFIRSLAAPSVRTSETKQPSSEAR